MHPTPATFRDCPLLGGFGGVTLIAGACAKESKEASLSTLDRHALAARFKNTRISVCARVCVCVCVCVCRVCHVMPPPHVPLGLRKKTVAPGASGLDDHLRSSGSTDLFGSADAIVKHLLEV